MSDDYTPSMADLREAYVLSRTRDSLRTEAVIAEARTDANRAIAAHDKELGEQIARHRTRKGTRAMSELTTEQAFGFKEKG